MLGSFDRHGTNSEMKTIPNACWCIFDNTNDVEASRYTVESETSEKVKGLMISLTSINTRVY